MKKYLFLSIVFFAVAGFTAYAQEAPDTTKHHHGHGTHDMQDSLKKAGDEIPTTAWNTVCPVMGKKVNPKVKLEVYNGKAYGFCCAGCDAKFAKDPEKYVKNLNEDGTRFTGKK